MREFSNLSLPLPRVRLLIGKHTEQTEQHVRAVSLMSFVCLPFFFLGCFLEDPTPRTSPSVEYALADDAGKHAYKTNLTNTAADDGATLDGPAC